MAAGWNMGMDFGMHGLDGPGAAAAASPASYMYGLGVPLAETLRVDDLLDFSNHDLFPSSATDPSSTSSAAAASHFLAPPPAPLAGFAGSGGAATFSDDLYIPCEEAAELEWLSQFVDDSFSDFPYPTAAGGGMAAAAPAAPAAAAPGRGARSKRSKGVSSHHRAHPSANIWSSSASTTSSSSSSSSEFPSSAKPTEAGTAARRCCTHCGSEKTPQWRTGPLGPKTLCNACGVRFKSGRLVPEYRPAASPTFVLTQHSNSHRKVLELRRQKEMLGHISSSPSGGAASLPELLFHDYEVC